MSVDGETKHVLDLMNPPNVFVNGTRVRDIASSDSLPLSGRLLPDFHRRRNIKDMFVRKPSTLSADIPTPTSPVPAEKTGTAEKRKLAASRTPPKPIKRGKSGVIADTSKGQQSMKAFFKPKIADRIEVSPIRDTVSISQSSDGDSQSKSIGSQELVSDARLATMPEPETVFDPIVSKESWDALFTKRPPPLCEGHEEPCKSYTTKKNGMNRGRTFWICAR